MEQWWSSFGDFEADNSGLYPQACQVVAHYRRLVGWSQEQLADKLGIKVRAQYYSEEAGRGLDSITRLRELRALLNVPPMLLGLCDVPGSAGWWASEYEPWPTGLDGWPDVGAVVKSYRKATGWTQNDLASALGIQSLAVRQMEKQTNLDSLTRRKALHFLLKIPPVLLGLDSMHIQQPWPTGVVTPSNKSVLPSLEHIQSAQKNLWAGYYEGHGQDGLKGMNWQLFQPGELLSLLPDKDQGAYLEQLSLLYQAAGNIALASADSRKVLSFMNVGIKLARLSSDKNLLSTALGRRAAALYELGEQELAEKSIRKALAISSKIEAVKRYPVASRVLSISAIDKQDRKEIYGMLNGIIENDRYQNGVDPNIILWCRAQVFINLAENAPNRGELLAQAEELLYQAAESAPDTPRRALIIKLEQAKLFARQRQYSYAATVAVEAFQLMKKLKSVLYVPQFIEIYRSLAQSNQDSSPEVARLGLMLFQAGALG